MPGDQFKLVSCDGKAQLTQRQAVEISDRQRRKYHKPMEWYRCPLCGFFHTGRSIREKHNPRRKAKDVRHHLVAHPNRKRKDAKWEVGY